MITKICALIRQTWYETAKKNLKPEERLRFYEMCLEYEFNDLLPDEDAPFAARLLFDMVRNDIDTDKAKAQARAERSRQNGALGGRPVNTGEQADNPSADGAANITPINTGGDNPEKPSGLSNNLYRHYTTQHDTTHNRETQDNDTEDSHTFFSVCLNFFERGCSKPVEEANTFWGYYESLGWRTKNGGAIVDRLALAKAWRLGDCSRVAMRNRLPYVDLMHKANPTEPYLLEDFVGMVRDAESESVVITYQEKRSVIVLEHKYMPALRQWIPKKQDGTPYELKYSYLQQTFD